ncbi:MAG: twin-arginine translocation pathway signal, partial [Pseudomonadota bacterium]
MMDRRKFLTSAVLGCSAAASPLVTPLTLASAPWEGRLVVIILRGALDGLDAVRPLGDPGYLALREGLLETGAEDHGLDGFFALHPGLSPLVPLWQAGELSVAHATSTPYRDKRSHFDGQAILEAGAWARGGDIPVDGWVNRLLQIAPGVEARTAFSVGRERMHLLAGAGPHATWLPKTELALSAQAQQLLELVYHEDPLFRDAARQAGEIIADVDAAPMMEEEDEAAMGSMMDGMAGGPGLGRFTGEVARFVVEQLRLETRIAAFSLGGWDTHSGQSAALNR